MNKILLFIFLGLSQVLFAQNFTEEQSITLLKSFVCDNITEFQKYVIQGENELYIATECGEDLSLIPQKRYSIVLDCVEINLKIWPHSHVFFEDKKSSILLKKCIIKKKKIIFIIDFYLNEKEIPAKKRFKFNRTFQ